VVDILLGLENSDAEGQLWTTDASLILILHEFLVALIICDAALLEFQKYRLAKYMPEISEGITLCPCFTS
jgi:hypothetical protein